MDECVCMNVCNAYVVCIYFTISVPRFLQFLVPPFDKKGMVVCAPYVVAYVFMLRVP